MWSSSLNLFYYPYATLGQKQQPLLTAVAAFFDTLAILDPYQASGDRVGVGDSSEALHLLEEAKLLKRIAPADVLFKYESELECAIEADMNDPDFIRTCQNRSEYPWTLALEKIPKAIRNDPDYMTLDQAMQRLMQRGSSEYQERYLEKIVSVAGTNVPQASSNPGAAEVGSFPFEREYRYVQVPFALGESIMLNHCLFAGLVEERATPFTMDAFHQEMLAHKIRRAPSTVLNTLDDGVGRRQQKTNILSLVALTATDLSIPVVSPELPLEEVLDYRNKHADTLDASRSLLADLAWEMESAPLSGEFFRETDSALAALRRSLLEVGKARDSWIKANSWRLDTVGVATAAASMMLSLAAAPVTPFAFFGAALGLAATALPFGKNMAQAAGGSTNSVCYLLREK
ncbi:DUF6236 family protein [Arthrobacter sp. D1-17]